MFIRSEKLNILQTKTFQYKYKGNSYHESNAYHIELTRGYYSFELWGCSSTVNNPPSNGAYVKGYIFLTSTKEFYLHVCHKGEHGMLNYSYGGGGPGQFGGGGATDIRLLPGEYDNFTSLKSWIIVAAGAGATDSNDLGGPGGTIEGFNSHGNYGKGGTQISGGQGDSSGKFGKGGGNPNRIDASGNAGGGSGYFGGGTSTIANDYGGGGGSSFISGYPGCIAIAEDSTENSIKFRTSEFTSIHYSGLKFEEPLMLYIKNIHKGKTTTKTIILHSIRVM